MLEEKVEVEVCPSDGIRRSSSGDPHSEADYDGYKVWAEGV